MISDSLTRPAPPSRDRRDVRRTEGHGGEVPEIGRTRESPAFGTVLALLAVVGGVVPIAYAWHFGALGIPRNDDWAYIRAAFHLAESGRVTGSGWAGMNLVGQLVLSLPVIWVFGHRVAALQVEVAAVGVLGLVATFDLAKQLLRPRPAIFVAVLIATSPMWASLSASYMTDVPSFAFAMACLALGVRAVARRPVRPWLLGASLAIGFAGFTIRESALFAPLAVAGVAMWRAPRRLRARLCRVVAVTAGLLVAAALFYAWRRSLPGFINPSPQGPSLDLANRTLRGSWQSALLLAVLVSPAALLADPVLLLRSSWTRAPRATLVSGLSIVALLGSALFVYGSAVAVVGPGDYVLPNGSLGTEMLHGSRPDLVPKLLLAALAFVGAATLVVLACAAGATVVAGAAKLRRGHLPTAGSPAVLIIVLAVVGYVVSCVVPVATGYSKNLFDRYLLPVVPLVAILALAARPSAAPRAARVAGAVSLAALALVGAAYGANSASFDGAKWAVARQAEKLAGDPALVDGGHIWNDYVAGRHLRGPFEGACIALRAESRPAFGGVVTRSVWGPTGTQTWVVARPIHPCR